MLHNFPKIARFAVARSAAGDVHGWRRKRQLSFDPIMTSVGFKLAKRQKVVFIMFKLDWKFPVGAGLPGLPGGPSHCQGITFSPHSAAASAGLR